MKKLIVSVITIAILTVSSAAVADTKDKNGSPPSLTQWTSFSILNDIKIPDEILFDIQMEFPGFAATKAAKVNKSGQEFYELRVDKSDVPSYSDGFYLYFDMDWEFVEKEDIPAPVPVFQPSKEKSEREPEPTQEEDREEDREEVEQEETEQIDDSDDNSGPGSNDGDPEPTDPVEPAEPIED